MKKIKSSYLLVLLFSVTLCFMSCQDNLDSSQTIGAQTLRANLSECIWAPFSQGANFILTIDFSNNDVIVYDSEREIVDEGSWSFVNGKFILSNLSGVMANYNGTWEIIEDREVFFELQKDGVKINFEQECSI